MLSATDLESIAHARLQDAEALFTQKRYDGAAYLSGYAVEIALKARIVKTLNWSGFPETPEEFEGLRRFKTHKLEKLLKLSGIESTIHLNFDPAWSMFAYNWTPESRYKPPGRVTHATASDMIESAKKLVGAIL